MQMYGKCFTAYGVEFLFNIRWTLLKDLTGATIVGTSFGVWSCKELSAKVTLVHVFRLKGQFHGFAHVQALALAVVNFTVSYWTRWC